MKVMNSTLTACLLLAASASAAATPGNGGGDTVEQWHGGPYISSGITRSYPAEWKAAGVGAVAGALVAGPPGFIVGAVGGVLAGRSAGLETDLRDMQQTLAQLERQRRTDADQLQQLGHRLKSETRLRREQLDAITRGFIFRVYFRTGQSDVEPAALQDLKNLAKALQELQALRIAVDAYADRRGVEGFNQSLSETRAEAVAQQLIRHGVNADRIDEQAHGERAARYRTDDPEGLTYDRQVVISLLLGEAS